jgi:hypothetical protein
MILKKPCNDKLVERIPELHKQSLRTPQESEMARRAIESTDRGIDKLMDELTEAEIKIIESS